MNVDNTPTVPTLNDAVDGLGLDLFELTQDGLEVQSLTGTTSFSGRTGCCCTTGSSTTCISMGGGACAC